MKKSDTIAVTTVGVGVAICTAVWFAWPSTPWYGYAAIAVSTFMAIPGAIKAVADQEAAKKILDE